MASSSAAAATSLSTLSFLAGATILLLGLLLPAEGALAACLTPPYLFFTVNLIILAVWGLSASPPARADEPPPVVAASACSDDDDDDREEPPAPPKKDAEAEEALHSDASCLTSDAEEEPAPAPATAWRSVRSAAAADEEVAESVCTDEMDRRFEEFIRKVNEQMRRQE